MIISTNNGKTENASEIQQNFVSGLEIKIREIEKMEGLHGRVKEACFSPSGLYLFYSTADENLAFVEINIKNIFYEDDYAEFSVVDTLNVYHNHEDENNGDIASKLVKRISNKCSIDIDRYFPWLAE
jgi:hypothetical protein